MLAGADNALNATSVTEVIGQANLPDNDVRDDIDSTSRNLELPSVH